METVERGIASRLTFFRGLTFAVAFFWFAILEWSMTHARIGVPAAGIMAIALTLWTTRWRTNNPSRIGLALGTFNLLACCLLGFGFVPEGLPQHVVAVFSALLLIVWLQQSMERLDEGIRGRIALLLMTCAYWLSLIGLLGSSIFANVDWWWLAVASGALTSTIAMVVWLEVGAQWLVFRRAMPFIFLLGAELYMVIWWLPTSVLVGSVIATTIMMLFLQLCRHIWLDTWQAVKGRRYIVVGGTIIALVMLTARWT